MIKKDIIRKVSSSTGLEKKEVEAVFDSVIQEMRNSIENGDNIYIRGFGTFEITVRSAKTARNISKNTTVIVPARKAVRFKVCKELADKVSQLKI